MEIKKVSKQEFHQYCENSFTVFHSSLFNELNTEKCEKLHYVVGFKDNKPKIAIIFGEQKDILKSPFSAPFGGSFLFSNTIDLEVIYDFPKALEEYVTQNNLKGIELFFPPLIYNQEFISHTVNSFSLNNYKTVFTEVNYHFETQNFTENYISNIHHSARKNLKKSSKENFTFIACITNAEKEEAYKVIALNRAEKGYPLKMEFNQLAKTIELIPHDFFILKNDKGVNVAASINFYVTKNIVQVIYWGNLMVYNHQRPMNYLSYKIFEFYKTKGIQIVDIGPSSENGKPSIGLCQFKSSIGCKTTLKFKIRSNNY